MQNGGKLFWLKMSTSHSFMEAGTTNCYFVSLEKDLKYTWKSFAKSIIFCFSLIIWKFIF